MGSDDRIGPLSGMRYDGAVVTPVSTGRASCDDIFTVGRFATMVTLVIITMLGSLVSMS
jgi:hypothetical protein